MIRLLRVKLSRCLMTFPGRIFWIGQREIGSTLPLCQFNLPDLGDAESDGTPSRLKLGPKAEYVYKIKLELPAKYTARAPLPFSLKRDYAEYQATYKLQGTTFTADRNAQFAPG